MWLLYSDTLDIAQFCRLFDNRNEWYKLIILVSKRRLNLRSNNAREQVAQHLDKVSKMKSCEKQEPVLECLAVYEDKDIIAMKQTLVQNIPYRLQPSVME